jgi:hypothetical protein
MKRLLPICAIGALVLLAGGCHFDGHAEARDAGPAVDRTFPVGAFDRIAVAGPYNVIVKTGGQPGVSARGGQAVLDDTEVVVENGVLKIKSKSRFGNWHWGKDNQVRMTVNAAAIRGATIAGSGNVRTHATGTADVSVMGSGDVEVTGGAKCSISKHGSGDVRCS